MKYLLLWVVVTFLSCLSIASERDPTPVESPDTRPVGIADLVPTMDRREVSIRFTVDELSGVAGRFKPGQAPSFVIYTKREHDATTLSVWVEGELANVLDRLQMSCYQSNQFKKGTVIEATGVVRIHNDTSSGELYTIYVDKWQKFRILPPARPKQT